MASVVIPAHNEASVIGRALLALTEAPMPGNLEIVVVCNGCTDDTAAVAREFGTRVCVVETPIASKIAALNLGDQHAASYPRVYLDADVVLPRAALLLLVKRLEDDRRVLAAGPAASFAVDGCSWAVRAFYSINAMLPSAREGIGGSGAYALSAAGRARFGEFPQLTADDGYVRIQFAPSERATVDAAVCTVFAPRKLSNLVAIKTRSHLGSYELARRFPRLWPNRGVANDRALLRLFLQPQLWPRLAVYCFVKIEARRRARRRLKNMSPQGLGWERDETSRANLVEARQNASLPQC